MGIGALVKYATEVKAGDIVGHASSLHDVRLYCINKVEITPSLPCLMPHVPRVFFKAPHVGLVISQGKLFRHYIYTPMPAESYCYSWADYSDMPTEEMVQCKKDYWDIIKGEMFDMYLITDERYKKLGSVIPQMEVPTWGILAQTTNGEQPIYDFVAEIQEDLKKAKEIHDRIKQKMYGVR